MPTEPRNDDAIEESGFVPATVANMKQLYPIHGNQFVAVSMNFQGEEASANPADYFALGDDDVLRDHSGDRMILAERRPAGLVPLEAAAIERALHTSEGTDEEDRTMYEAAVFVERPEQVDELVRLAADAEIGLSVAAEPTLGGGGGFELKCSRCGSGDLMQVNESAEATLLSCNACEAELVLAPRGTGSIVVVDVDGRKDGIYAFERQADADRFAAPINSDGITETNDAFVQETPVNVGDAAERLIAAERGDRLEDAMDWSAVAEDVREGQPLPAVLTRLRSLGEGRTDAAQMIEGWIEQDRQAGVTPSEDAAPLTLEARRLREGWRVKAPGAAAWSTIRKVEFDAPAKGKVTARLDWGCLIYRQRERVRVLTSS